jgi:hypothetical protein
VWRAPGAPASRRSAPQRPTFPHDRGTIADRDRATATSGVGVAPIAPRHGRIGTGGGRAQPTRGRASGAEAPAHARGRR